MPRRHSNKEQPRTGVSKALIAEIAADRKRRTVRPTLEVHGRRFVGAELRAVRKETGRCCPFCESMGQWICGCGAVNKDDKARCRSCGGRRSWFGAEVRDR